MNRVKTLPVTRTILVTGFKDINEMKEYTQLVEDLDEVYETYNIPGRLNVFVTFYDFRKSLKHFQTFRQQKMMPHLNFFHTVSRKEIQKGNEEVQCQANQSSMIIYFHDVSTEISDNEIMRLLTQYGEIRDIRLSRPHQKIVEFFDFRDAKRAFQALNNQSYRDGHIVIYYVWDTMMNYKNEIIRRTDAILKALPVDEELAAEQREEIEKKRAKITPTESPNLNVNGNANLNNANNNNAYSTVTKVELPEIPSVQDIFDYFIFQNVNEIDQMKRY